MTGARRLVFGRAALGAEIRAVEARIEARRERLAANAAAAKDRTRDALVSPAGLATVAGIGLVLGWALMRGARGALPAAWGVARAARLVRRAVR